MQAIVAVRDAELLPSTSVLHDEFVARDIRCNLSELPGQTIGYCGTCRNLDKSFQELLAVGRIMSE